MGDNLEYLSFVAIKIMSKQKDLDYVLWHFENNGYTYYFFPKNDGTSMLFVYDDQISYAMTVLEDYRIDFEVISC